MITKSKGFTLIELLIVVAIIGILASIVLVSLGGSENTSKDASSKVELGQLRGISATLKANKPSVLFTSVHTTGTVSFCDATEGDAAGVASIKTSIIARQGTNKYLCKVSTSGDAWVSAFVTLTDNDKAWCVDSTGNAKSIDVHAKDGAILANNNDKFHRDGTTLEFGSAVNSCAGAN